MTVRQRQARASFQTRLLLHLANRRRRSGNEAFTLVELMIVVAILGILAAVALPNYLQARSASAMSSRISEAVSFAKACAVFSSTGVGDSPATQIGEALNGVTAVCDTAGGTITAKWGEARAAGVKCLVQTSTTSHKEAVIKVTTGTGDQITCSFG